MKILPFDQYPRTSRWTALQIADQRVWFDLRSKSDSKLYTTVRDRFSEAYHNRAILCTMGKEQIEVHRCPKCGFPMSEKHCTPFFLRDQEKCYVYDRCIVCGEENGRFAGAVKRAMVQSAKCPF